MRGCRGEFGVSETDVQLTAMSRFMDLEMMMNFNAIERDTEGWKALFEKADPRLMLKNIVTPQGSAQSVMEVVLKQD